MCERSRSPCSDLSYGGIISSSRRNRLISVSIFSCSSFIVAIPSAVKVFNWTATTLQGIDLVDTPMLYGSDSRACSRIGGLTRLFVATLPIDVHVTDTYFVIAALPLHHGRRLDQWDYLGAFTCGGREITAVQLSPRMIGRRCIIFIGFNLTFFPQFILGYLGMPAALPCVPAGIPGAQRAVVGLRRVDLGVGYLIPLCVARVCCATAASPVQIRSCGSRFYRMMTSPPPTENFPRRRSPPA